MKASIAACFTRRVLRLPDPDKISTEGISSLYTNSYTLGADMPDCLSAWATVTSLGPAGLRPATCAHSWTRWPRLSFVNTFMTLLTGGGLAVIGGVLTGLANNWSGAKRDQRSHARQLQLAQEERQQARLQQAYTDLGLYLSRVTAWARSVRPLWGPVPPPDQIPAEELWQVETAVTLHGSPEVRQLLNEWAEQRIKIEKADFVIQQADNAVGREPELEEEARHERLALDGNKKAMYEAADAIRAQTSAELAGGGISPRRRS